jgi:TP901 family phage tail tape measure protein
MADLAELDLVINSAPVKKATGDLNIFIDAAGRAHDTTGKFISSANKLGVEAGVLGRSLKFAASQAAAFAAASAALFAAGAGVKAVVDFDKATQTLRGTIQGTAEDFADLRQQAKELGAATVFSAGESAKAQLELARAGQDVNSILLTTPKVLNLATVAEISLAEAAKLTTQALAQFELDATNAGRVTDVLTTAANAAQTSVPQLSEALSQAGVISKQTGKSFEETVAAIAVLQDAGLEGSQAGTALRSSMAALLNPSKRAADILEELAKRSGKTKDAFDISKSSFLEVARAIDEAGASSKDLAAIFGTEGFNAASILSGSPEKLEKFIKALEDGKGAAEALATVMGDTLSGAFNNLTSAVESLFIQTSDAGLGGSMKDLLNTLANAISILAGLADANAKADSTANALANAIKAASIGLMAFVAIAAAGKVLELAKSIGSVTQAFRLLNATLKANPILAIASLIAILVFALLELADTFTTVDGESVRVGNIMKATWEEVTRVITELWAATTEALTSAWKSAADTFSSLWTESVDEAVGENKRLEEDTSTTWASIKDAVRAAINAMVRPLVQFYRSVQTLLKGLAATILAFKELDFSSGKGLADSLDRFGEAFKIAFDAEGIAKEMQADLTRDFVGAAFEVGSAFGTSLSTEIDKSVKNIKERAKELQKIEDAAPRKRGPGAVRATKPEQVKTDVARSTEDAANKVKQAKEALQELIATLKQEKDAVGLNDNEKERLDLLLQTRALVKEIFQIPKDSELFTNKQLDTLNQVNAEVDMLLKRVQAAKAFEALRVKSDEAFTSIAEQAAAAGHALSLVFASPGESIAIQTQQELAAQIQNTNTFITERVRLGKISVAQAEKERASVQAQVGEIVRLKVAADGLAQARSGLQAFIENAQKAGEVFRTGLLSTETGGRISAATQQLIAPLKDVEKELVALQQAGAITADQYSASMAKIGQATQAAALLAEQAEVLNKVRTFANTISTDLGNAFKSVVLGAKTAEQAAADFFAALADAALTQILIQPMVDLLTSGITRAVAGATGMTAGATTAAATLTAGGIATAEAMVLGATQAAAILSSQAAAGTALKVGGAVVGGAVGAANGAVYNAGVLKFARGGILDKPAMFALRGGKLGVAGEAGPEAIMPVINSSRGPAVHSSAGPLLLQRQGNGKLGVDATPGRSGTADLVQPTSGQPRSFAGAPEGSTRGGTQNVTFIVQTPAVDSFKKSSDQFAKQMRRVTRGK